MTCHSCAGLESSGTLALSVLTPTTAGLEDFALELHDNELVLRCQNNFEGGWDESKREVESTLLQRVLPEVEDWQRIQVVQHFSVFYRPSHSCSRSQSVNCVGALNALAGDCRHEILQHRVDLAEGLHQVCFVQGVFCFFNVAFT